MLVVGVPMGLGRSEVSVEIKLRLLGSEVQDVSYAEAV